MSTRYIPPIVNQQKFRNFFVIIDDIFFVIIDDISSIFRDISRNLTDISVTVHIQTTGFQPPIQKVKETFVIYGIKF